jgi:CheY-like chemotaxis protein
LSAEPNLSSPRSLREPAASPAEAHKLEALAQLTGGVAHDFNNVLQVIQSAVELLRRRLVQADPDTARLVDMVKRNADRAAGLTRRLLAYSGRQPLEAKPVNPNRLIADMPDRLRQAVGGSVAVETVLGGGLWWVVADPGELETAILNLASNGRDAMPTGGTLTIETRNVASNGEQVAIIVRDTGIGMTSDVVARAFDPYFTTKDIGHGTGLGLSQVYGLVKQLKGEVTIESALHHGTTVTIRLPRLAAAEVTEMTAEPRAAAADAVASLAAARSPQGAGSGKKLAGLRVLVVEDESLIGMLVEDLLEQLGCHMVGLVSSVDKALDMAARADIDVALLDVDLGGDPVYPVAAALQARGVPFVFMSGYGGLDAQWRSRPSVQKPFELSQLKQEVERALNAP